MGLKRLSLLTVLAAIISLGVVSAAPAGNFDEPRMGCSGESPATCPTGTEGQPYSLPIELSGDEDEACAVFSVTSGSLPPGLSLTRPYVNETGSGLISGTPTQAGTYDFFLTVRYDREVACPFKNPSDDSFKISINPGIPKLTIGPEQSGVPVGTVGAAYRLQMTANLSDAKTWSIVSGTLPPGTGIDAASGVISGTPATAGTYVFTVQAVINPQQSDTKTLAITVRDQVRLEVAENPDAPAGTTPGGPAYEVGVPISIGLTASGGTGTFTWSVSGRLPRGVTFLETGELTGRPRQAGTFRFLVTVRDTEGRTAAYNGALGVAPRLAIKSRRLRASKVDKIYIAKLKTRGGIAPVEWKLVRGKLPDGVWLDWASGTILGLPVKAGRFRFRIQAIDAFGVKSTRTYLVRVFPAPKKNR